VGDAGASSSDAAQRAAFEERAARIRAMDDLTEAFEEAGKLVTTQLEFRRDAAQLRADMARRIREAGDLSIGQLAARLGLSKGRTDRMLRRAGQPPADDE
jgi:DNA-binding transcriptional regulator YiaG